MATEIEILARAYRTLWRQEADAIRRGSLKITRDGIDETQAALARYEMWTNDISTMLDRLDNA